MGRSVKARTMNACFAVSLISLFLVSAEGSPQIKLADLFKKIPFAGISENEAGQGVKEALAQGITKAVLNLHQTDGFFGNDLYKLFLPPDARKAETTLRKIGLSGEVDKAILAMNRGAEDAV